MSFVKERFTESKLTSDVKATASLKDQLEELLSEDIEGVRKWELSAFDELTDPFNESLVLIGAGNLGRQILTHLRKQGIEPLAFADDNPSLWNTFVDNLEVLSVPDAVQRFGQKAAFVITIWGDGVMKPLIRVRQQLQELGCSRFASFVHLYWKYAESFLPNHHFDAPHNVYQQADEVRECFSLWADEASRRQYIAQLKWRMFLDFDKELHSLAEHEIYFPDDLISVVQDEVFIDCGAYDGDTIKVLLRRQNSSFKKIVAFDPDPENFRKLQSYISALPIELKEKIDIHQLGISDRKRRLRFYANRGSGSSFFPGAGDIVKVDCVTLDEFLAEYPTATFIKMDIEGFEPPALAGGRKLIEQHSPVLAISLYHAQEHLWKIPLFINSVSDHYRFYLRPHEFAYWDLVLYAIPVNRLHKHLRN